MASAPIELLERAEQFLSAAIGILKIGQAEIEVALNPLPDHAASDHRAADALLRPILTAARDLLRTHDQQLRLTKAALAAVQARK